MLSAFLASTVAKYAVGSLGALIIGYILKKLPTHKWAKSFESIGEKQGKAVTKFFNSKLPKLYNKVIEPIFIDALNAFLIAWAKGFTNGLKSDDD